MNKFTPLSLVLVAVTASLLASCGSTGGGSGHSTTNSSALENNSSSNSHGSNPSSSNASANASSTTDHSSSNNTASASKELAVDLSQINTTYQLTHNNLNLNNDYALTFKPYYLNYINTYLEQGNLPFYHNNNYLIYAVGASDVLSYQDHGVKPINPLVASTIPTTFNTASYQPTAGQPYASSPNLYVPKVLVVDNNFNQDYITSANFIKAKALDLTSVNSKFSWKQATTSSDPHGFYVGSLIAGRSQDLAVKSEPSTQPAKVRVSGLVPYSEISFVGLSLDTNPELNRQQMAVLDQIYQYAYAQTKPDVINNSFGLSLVDPLNAHQASLINQNYDILAKGITQVTANDQTAPLFVYAAGNYNSSVLFSKLQAEFRANSSINYLDQILANPNYGVGLGTQSALAKLVVNPRINPYLIVVSGFVYDTPYSNKNLNFNTANKRRLMANLVNQNDLKTPEQSESEYLSSLDHPADAQATAQQGNNRFNRHTYQFKDRSLPPDLPTISNQGHIYSALGAYQCGAAAYDCITAPYIYQQPYVNNGQLYGQVKGTSFAAPYVSAAALLVKQKFPWMTASNLKTTVLTTATDVGALGVDPVFGWGVLNIGRALLGPAQFAFGDFKVDFGNNPVNFSHGVSPQSLISLFTTNPYLNSSYLANVSTKFSFYDFNAVTGKGGLSLDNSKQVLNSGLRIYIAGYQGTTKVKNSVLVLENPLYRKNQVQVDYIANRTFYHQLGLPEISYLNNDAANHPIAYKHRIDEEISKVEQYGDASTDGKTVGYNLGSSSSIYGFSDANSYPLVPDMAVDKTASDKPYSFSGPIIIDQQGIVVSNLPEINHLENNAGYFFPYSYFTYGQYGGYYHDAPYQGSIIHNFTQKSLGTTVFGISLNDKSPYQASDNSDNSNPSNNSSTDHNSNASNTNNLASHTVVDAGTKKPVVYHYSSVGATDPDTSKYKKGHEPYARADQVVSTAIFSDQAQIAGKALVYFNFGAKLSNGDEATHQVTAESQQTIKLSSTAIPYVPTVGLDVSLVNAKALSGNFTSVSFVDNNLASKYQLSGSRLEQNFTHLDAYPQSLVVTIKPIDPTTRVAVSSGRSVLDQALLANSASGLDHLYTKADQQYFGTNTKQNYLALASAAQSSDNLNFRTYLYQNALTVYPDLQLASSQNTHTQVSNFIDRVSTNYLHSVSHSVYFDYNYRQTNWTSPTSAVFGQDKGHNLSLGYYGQSYGLNYGIAGIVNYGNWQEDLTSLNADLAHLQANNLTSLASAKTLSAGLVASLGKALPRSFYALNLATTFHNYDLNRNLLFLTESTKFNALDLELAGRYGYSLVQTDHARFSVIGGLSLVDNYRLAIKETATINPSKLEQVTGNTDAQAVAEQFAYTSLDAKAHNTLNVYASLALDYTYNFKLFNFNQALSIQTKAERVLNNLNFNVNSETNGSSLASTSVFNNNYVISAKANYKVNFTTSFSVDVYASYSMCQNWHTKTAGTSLTYSF